MKRYLILALLTVRCFAQAPVTVSGTVTDSSNNLATSGYVQFDLQPFNQSITYHIPNTTTIAPQTSKCSIIAGGQLAGYPSGTGSCFVWGTDVIVPANTCYNITIAPANVVASTWQCALITGSVANLATLVFVQPQPVTGTIIKGSPLVTQSVVPDVPNTRTIGTAQNPYAAVYAQNLNAVGAGLGSNNNWTGTNTFNNPTSFPGGISGNPSFSGTVSFPGGIANLPLYATYVLFMNGSTVNAYNTLTNTI